jgi:hypothetical protein
VILGNPPYNAFAGVSAVAEKILVKPYKEELFFRRGLRSSTLTIAISGSRPGRKRIAEKTGKGVVCYISNYSYLGDPSFVVMRQRFLKFWLNIFNPFTFHTPPIPT